MEAFNAGFSCTGIHTCVPPHTIPHLWHIQCLVHDEGRVGLLDLAEDKDAPAGGRGGGERRVRVWTPRGRQRCTCRERMDDGSGQY